MYSPPLVPTVRRLLPPLLAGSVIMLVGLIMWPFLVAIIWAALIAHMTWPLFSLVQSRLGEHRALAALLMVAGLGGAIGLPLLWLVILVQGEITAAYRAMAAFLDSSPGVLPDTVVNIPWVGPTLRDWFATHLANSAALKQLLAQWTQRGAGHALTMLSGMGGYATTFAFSLLTLFFFYRDGDSIVAQGRLVLRSTVGKRFEAYVLRTGTMSRAIVLSVVLAACAQGAISALGYWIFGVEAPALLGLITAVFSVVPVFGTLLVWGVVSAWLLINGHSWQALGLFAWGTFLINPTDNLLRPFLVSNAAKIPFLLGMFGVFGGLSAFGLVGALLGPLILAIGSAMWKEWINTLSSESDESTAD